jgi:Leucine-rich repeat (LRR) protein
MILTTAVSVLILATACDKAAPEDMKVSGVTLDRETLSIIVGDGEALTVILKATVAPAEAMNKAVTWSSSDLAVATVDGGGKVTAEKEGTTLITVSTADGGHTAICVVTVTDENKLPSPTNLLDPQYIPDPVFFAYCDKLMATWDINRDGGLSPEEAAAVTNMDVANISGVIVNNIASLKGVEHFTGLRILDCYNLSNLTRLDVSACSALKTLTCWGCSLTTLNVSGCAALERLDVSDNKLTVLDLSNTPMLKDLKCGGNRLSSLYVSNCAALESLECYRNELTILDVSKNTALTILDCYRNNLAALDVSQNVPLRRLVCGENKSLAALDLSKNTALDDLNCDLNSLTALDLTHNSALESFSCVSNHLSELTVGARHDRLEYFNCSINDLAAEQLNDIFRALPDLGPEGPTYTVYVDNNPGAATCDVLIATNKNWKVENRQNTRSMQYYERMINR